MAAFEFATLSLISLLIMVNPISIMPTFVSLTSHKTSIQSRKFAMKATLAALIALLVFAVIGKLIFAFFSISLESLRIVGGILFFIVGHEMITGQSEIKNSYNAEGGGEIDQSITPVGVPLICGPGAISTVMLLMNQCNTTSHKALLLVTIVVVATITFLTLISARRIVLLIGETGVNVMMRITGLIVMAVAVEFLITGLSTVVPRILGA